MQVNNILIALKQAAFIQPHRIYAHIVTFGTVLAKFVSFSRPYRRFNACLKIRKLRRIKSTFLNALLGC